MSYHLLSGQMRNPRVAQIVSSSGYTNGHLSDHPVSQLDETIPLEKIYWSGLAYHPRKNLLYAANRGTTDAPSNVVVFDTRTRQILTRIPVEVNPYELVFSADGETLFVSN